MKKLTVILAIVAMMGFTGCGNKQEQEVHKPLDPTPKTFTETILTENIITENEG